MDIRLLKARACGGLSQRPHNSLLVFGGRFTYPTVRISLHSTSFQVFNWTESQFNRVACTPSTWPGAPLVACKVMSSEPKEGCWGQGHIGLVGSTRPEALCGPPATLPTASGTPPPRGPLPQHSPGPKALRRRERQQAWGAKPESSWKKGHRPCVGSAPPLSHWVTDAPTHPGLQSPFQGPGGWGGGRGWHPAWAVYKAQRAATVSDKRLNVSE